MPDCSTILARLARSRFRAGIKLTAADRAYLERKGLDVVLEHARTFIDRRLAPAMPAQDGRQTPWRGHPAFSAQHATATCCRSCLAKWHGIDKGRPLTDAECERIVTLIGCWLRARAEERVDDGPDQLDLLEER